MNEAERVRVGALVSVLVLLVPGFLFHEAPRFPGSLVGGAFGVVGAFLLVLLLVYSLAKRGAPVRTFIAKRASMRALLAFHVYAGVLGALLGIIHSGHAFRSPLGVALVATMLIVVLSGFAGHYYLVTSGAELKDQQAELAVLRDRYVAASKEIRASWRGAELVGVLEAGPVSGAAAIRLPGLLAAMADLDYAITAREQVKRVLSRWTVVHVASALAMYSLLALHVWNGIYFGLRWLR